MLYHIFSLLAFTLVGECSVAVTAADPLTDTDNFWLPTWTKDWRLSRHSLGLWCQSGTVVAYNLLQSERLLDSWFLQSESAERPCWSEFAAYLGLAALSELDNMDALPPTLTPPRGRCPILDLTLFGDHL